MISRHQSGQSLMEFALVVTLLLVLLLGIVDFGLAYYTQIVIKNAVAEGGYYASQHPRDDAGVRRQIKQELQKLNPPIKDSDITITRVCTSNQEKTEVAVNYQYQLLINWSLSNTTVTLGDKTSIPQIGGC